MKKYVIYLLVRCFSDYNHPKIETTPADDVEVHCEEEGAFERNIENVADNVTVTILDRVDFTSGDSINFLSTWYDKWEHPQKEAATQYLFDDNPVIDPEYGVNVDNYIDDGSW